MVVTGTLSGGGSEKQVYYIVKAAQQLGLTVKVVTLEGGGIWQQRIESDLRQPVRVLPPGPRWWRLLQLGRLARAFRAAMIHTVHFYAGTYMTAAKIFWKAPVLVSVRTSYDLLLRRTRRFERILNFYGAEAIVCNSWAAVNALRNRAWLKRLSLLAYLPNTIDLNGPPPPPAWDARTEPFRLIFTGNISHGKNASLLLKVLRELHRNGYDVAGMVVGKGRMLGEVIAEAEALGISDIVEFHGEVMNVTPLLRRAHAFFFPSLNEGMPNAVMEAVAAGLPVISSRVGDVPRLIRDGNGGFLFEKNNVTEAYQKTQRLIENYGELAPSFSHEAFSYLKNHYAFAHFPARLAFLYRRIYNRYHGIK